MAEWVLGGLASSVYLYNRENFMFDKTLRLKREFQGQGMRIKQFSLYREDVRDLMNLTVSKMDNYLLVNTLQLGFCIVLLTEGRPRPSQSPQWLLWLWSMTVVGALFYFLMSAWMAIHASIAAHSFGVRMLTQFVRLPVPNQRQLDAARAHASDFEGLSARDMLRIPVVKQQFRRLNAAMDNLTSQDAELESDAPSRMESDMISEPEAPRNAALPEHTRLYRELQANWQAYDAYARVCMALGTNQMMYAVGYDVLQMLVLLELSPEPALACVIVCAAAAWLLARLDLYLSKRLLTFAAVLLVAPLAVSLVALIIFESDVPGPVLFFGELLVVAVFAMHVVWLIFIVHIAKADNFGSLSLPRNFRSVLYLDVFGQMEVAPAQGSLQQPLVEGVVAAAASPEDAPGDSLDVNGLPSVPEDPSSWNSLASHRQESAGSLMMRQRSSSVSSVAGLAMRPELRSELAGLCWRLKAELEVDLLRWESAQLAELVGPDGHEVAQVSRLRAASDEVTERLQGLAPGGGGASSSGGAEGTMPRAWLKLEWNPDGNPTEFWYGCDSREVSWIEPREPNIILELQGLQAQLDTLVSRVEALAELQPEEIPEVDPLPAPPPAGRPSEPTPERHKPSREEQPLVGQSMTGSTQPPLETGPSGCWRTLSGGTDATASFAGRQRAPPGFTDHHCSSLSAGTSRPASGWSVAEASAGSQRTSALNAAEAEGQDEGPAQVTRFGGQEALEGEALRNAFGVNTASAAQTFHPHRPNPGVQEGRIHQDRRPPGQLPWLTFRKGSLTLISVWILGLLWIIAKVVLRVDIPVAPPEPDPEPELRLVAEGPHPFYGSAGMVCQEGLRSVFVVERYSVHEVRLDAAGLGEDAWDAYGAGVDLAAGKNASVPVIPAALRPALVKCLAQAPDFHGAGLRGLALECASASAEDAGAEAAAPWQRCAALLLGAGGHGALRCELGAEEVDAAAPSRAAAFGGPWRGFVPSRGGEAVWAERERDGALVMLQRSFGTDSTLVPQFEVPRSSVDGLTRFHILEDAGVVLGLKQDGLLRAWPLSGASAAGIGGATWSLRLGSGRRWLGLCSMGEALFLLAAPSVPTGARPKPAAVWRLPLPQELRRLQRAAA